MNISANVNNSCRLKAKYSVTVLHSDLFVFSVSTSRTVLLLCHPKPTNPCCQHKTAMVKVINLKTLMKSELVLDTICGLHLISNSHSMYLHQLTLDFVDFIVRVPHSYTLFRK